LTTTAPVAAIDCGTNSTRLLIAEPDGTTLTRLMHITRLGQDVDRTGRLAPEAIERTVSVLRRYRSVMDEHGVERVRMTATSAARDAANRADFFAAAAGTVGVEPELLSGDEEATLSFFGATEELGLDGREWWLVADIGGGSTELAVGPSPDGPDRPIGARSLDVGCVRLTERCLPHDPVPQEDLDAARRLLIGMFEQATAEVPELAKAQHLLGLAGTVSALASYEMGLHTYDRDRIHHHHLSRSAVRRALGELAAMPASDRVGRPGIEAARADVIVGGALILDALMDFFGLDECVASESDILDGLARSLLKG
jgi:exopolyphosphatase/guanosine-5'-triphosphate,3'-diphosphate pyrophosphatase